MLDLIFGFFSPGKKIYRSTIEKIPGHQFNRSVRMKVKGNEKQLVGEALRDHLARMASGGISCTSLEERLRKAGLKGKQYQRRKEIISIIKNSQEEIIEKSKNKTDNKNKINNI